MKDRKTPKALVIIGAIEGALCAALGILIFVAALTHLYNFESHTVKLLIRLLCGAGFLAIGGINLYNVKIKNLLIFIAATGINVLWLVLSYQLIMFHFR